MPEMVKNPEVRRKLKEYYKGEFFEGLSGKEDWTLVILSNPKNPEYRGKSILEIAEKEGKDVVDALCDVVEAEGASIGIIVHEISEEDVDNIARHRLTMVGSDGGIPASPRDMVHPRYYGTFTRVLGYQVRERKLFSLEEAVGKMTSLPAQKFKLLSRGLIREGMYADLVVFNPKTIRDEATLEEPVKLSEGVEYVIVNVRVVFEHGELTGEYPGKVLRYKPQETLK